MKSMHIESLVRLRTQPVRSKFVILLASKILVGWSQRLRSIKQISRKAENERAQHLQTLRPDATEATNLQESL